MNSASIIICTYNRAESLRRTLETMTAICVPNGLQVELLVVDNASTDQTAEVAQSCRLPNMPVRYIHEPRQGQVNARNTGIREARGEIILFIDDDVCPEKGWLVSHLCAYKDSQIAAVQGKVTVKYETPLPDWFDPKVQGEFASVNYGDSVLIPFQNHLVGANMSMRREVVQKLGGFNPLLGPGKAGFFDDSDFSVRLVEAGFIQSYRPDAHVYHMVSGNRMTPESYRNAMFRLGVSMYIAEDFGSKQSYIGHMYQFLYTSLRMLKSELKYLLRGPRPVCPQSELFYCLDRGRIWARTQGKQRLMRRYSSSASPQPNQS